MISITFWMLFERKRIFLVEEEKNGEILLDQVIVFLLANQSIKISILPSSPMIHQDNL